jgi:acyl-CoA thioester hydrolase
VTHDDELERRIRRGDARRCFAQPAPLVARHIRAARVRARRRERRGEVRVQPAKGADGESVAQHAPQHAVTLVFDWSKSVAVLDMRAPSGGAIDDRTESVVDPDVVAQHLATPAVMVAGDHRYGNARVDDVGERRERAEAPTRDHRSPLEPELEQITVDDERSAARRDMPEERHDASLHAGVGESEMRVAHHIAGRGRLEHARILPLPRSLYKLNCSGDPSRVSSRSPAPMPSAVILPHHDVEFRVRYAETDQMGVVYHTNYLVWCEVGRTDFIRARGKIYADIEAAGVGLAVSELSARFHAAARYDNLIRVRTTLAEIRSRSITFDYLITNAETGERFVTARTALVSIDPAGKLVALPQGVRALFETAP